jgi:DNA-binding SARP family transcriptional activator/tetratricopeptide (TPR) repeat protein
MLRLTTFGGLALSRDGAALTGAAAQRSRLSLLALLATAGPTGFSRDKLLLYLWPESDEERARHALKQAVYSLRRELGAEEVIVGTASLSLNPVLITSDAREFESAVAAGDLATAVSLYAGPFLDGFHLKDSTEFERWSAEQRAHYAHLWVSAVEKLAADREARGEWRDAAGYWRKLAASEPLSGRLALALMRSLAESGDLGAALQQYKVHEALLREEIGSAPEAAVTAFAESLRSGSWTRTPEAAGRGPRAAEPASEVNVPAAGIAPQPEARHPQPSIGAARRRRRRSTALAFVLGALLVMAVGLTVTYVRLASDPEALPALNLIRTRPAPKLEPRQIIVAPLENKTGDASLDPIGDQVADWFARELGEADFKVVDTRAARIASEVVKGIPRPLRADGKIAIGEESGSQYAIVGSYYKQGRDSLEANISIVDVGTRQTLRTLGPFRGSARPELSRDFISPMLDPTVAYLRAEVDTTAGGRTTRYSSPTSTAVQVRVNAAWEHFFQNSGDTAAVFSELDAAAKLDSTYPTPLLMKAYMLDVKQQWDGVRRVVAQARPLEPHMSRLEKTALELLESDLAGNALARVGIARRLQAMSPGSTEMPLLRVVSALYVGNVDEARAALRDVDPTRGMNVKAPTYFDWAGTTYHHSGNEALEEGVARELEKRFRDKPQATFALVRLAAANDSPDLEPLLRRGMPAGDDRSARADSIELWLFAARELRAHGHAAAAEAIFARTLSTFWPGAPGTGATLDDRRQFARTVYETGDFQRARALFQSILASDSTDLEAIGRIGTASVHLGDLNTARTMDSRLRTTRKQFAAGQALRWRAALASAQGKTDEAVSLLDMAVRRGLRLLDDPVNLTVHLDRDFVGIEASAPYKAMTRALTEASR